MLRMAVKLNGRGQEENNSIVMAAPPLPQLILTLAVDSALPQLAAGYSPTEGETVAQVNLVSSAPE